MIALVASVSSLVTPTAGGPARAATPDYSTIAVSKAQIPVGSWINADMPQRGQRAETSVRQMRGAFNSAPDYAAIAAAALATSGHMWLPSADEVVKKVDSPVRQMRAAFKSAPDYAKISGAVALAGALAYSQGLDMPGIHNGFDLASNAHSVKVLAKFDGAKAASPEYGAIALAAAMVGRNAVDLEDQSAAGLSF